MKAIFLFLLNTVIGAFSLSAQNAPVRKVWDKTFGGKGDDFISTILPTADGSYLLGGYSHSNKSGDKSANNKGDTSIFISSDIWIIQIDAQGNKLWDKTLGGNGEDNLRTMLHTPDGGYLLGGTSGSNKSGDKSEDSKGYVDFWIIKIDAQGNKLWDKTLGGSDEDMLTSMLATSDGGFLLGGTSWSKKGGDKSEDRINFDPKYPGDYWIIKIDAQGNKLWDKTLGGNFTDDLNAMTPTTDDGFLLGGSSNSNRSGDKSDNRKNMNSLYPLFDYWIIKVDAQGNKLWDKTLGGQGDDNLNAMLLTSDGKFLLGGISDSQKNEDKSENNRDTIFKDTPDYWIIKIDAQGNRLWDKTLGGTQTEYLYGAMLTSDNGSLYGGPSWSKRGMDKSENNNSNRFPDFWIVKIDPQGNKQWDKTLGGNNDDGHDGRGTGSRFVILPTDTGILLGGYSNSDKSGDKSDDCRGGYDFWIIKLTTNPDGITETTDLAHGLKVYPNPSDGTLTVSHPDNYTLDLFDVKGSLLRTLPVQDSTTELTGLATGLYLLRVTTVSGKTLTQKIVVN